MYFDENTRQYLEYVSIAKSTHRVQMLFYNPVGGPFQNSVPDILHCNTIGHTHSITAQVQVHSQFMMLLVVMLSMMAFAVNLVIVALALMQRLQSAPWCLHQMKRSPHTLRIRIR